MKFEFDWVDAFSDRPYSGNGCAVVYDNGQWSDEKCIAFTRETSLSECTFVAASDIADYRVRYFLASGEIPFAGHPTVATVVSLRERGLIGETSRLETGAGLIPIEYDDGWVKMRQNPPEFGQRFDSDEIVRLYGLRLDQIIAQPQLVSTGLPFIITLLADRTAIDDAILDIPALSAFQKRHNIDGFIEPYLCVIENRGTTGRLLLPPPNPAEDAFTGSASGAMACYLWQHEFITKSEFMHYQGHILGREGQAKIKRINQATPTAGLAGVWVAGQGYRLMTGHINS